MKMRWIQSQTARTAVMLWIAALALFAMPHPRLRRIDPVVHQPLFLIFVPALIASLPLFFRRRPKK